MQQKKSITNNAEVASRKFLDVHIHKSNSLTAKTGKIKKFMKLLITAFSTNNQKNLLFRWKYYNLFLLVYYVIKCLSNRNLNKNIYENLTNSAGIHPHRESIFSETFINVDSSIWYAMSKYSLSEVANHLYIMLLNETF